MIGKTEAGIQAALDRMRGGGVVMVTDPNLARTLRIRAREEGIDQSLLAMRKLGIQSDGRTHTTGVVETESPPCPRCGSVTVADGKRWRCPACDLRHFNPGRRTPEAPECTCPETCEWLVCPVHRTNAFGEAQRKQTEEP